MKDPRYMSARELTDKLEELRDRMRSPARFTPAAQREQDTLVRLLEAEQRRRDPKGLRT